MNTYTGGSSRMSPALALALALPAMLTTWMLDQPAVSGAVPADGNPLASISDVGQTIVGQPLALTASGFDPAQSGVTLAYNWDFGDGSTASGAHVTHTYHSAGTYTLTMTAISASGQRVVKKVLRVGFSPTIYSNPYTPLRGINTPNSRVKIPTSDSTLPAHPPLPAPFAQSTLPIPQASTSPLSVLPTVSISPPTRTTPGSTVPWLLIGGLLIMVFGACFVGVGTLSIVRKRRHPTT